MKQKLSVLSLLICILSVWQVKAQTMPNLGTASSFGILSGAYFSASDTVTVKGKIGSITGNLNIAKASARVSGTGTVIATALSDLASAKSALSAQGGTTISNTISNQTFTPGVYSISGNATVTRAIKLLGDSNSIYIFNISGDLTFDTAQINMVKNTVFASKIFWNVAGKVNIIGNNRILGNILAQKKIKVSSFDAGYVSLLSIDSVIILNPGVAIYNLSGRKSYFYSQNTINSFQNPAKTTTSCLSSALTCGNMITNPSFEDLVNPTACPSSINDIDYSCDWNKLWSMGTINSMCCYDYPYGYSMYGNSIGLSADFFSTCGGGDFYLPYNYYTGYSSPQSARTGNNCAGIMAQYERVYIPDFPTPNNLDPLQYKDNLKDNALKKKLPSPLIANKVYYVEFYANLANISNKSAKLAVYPMYNANPGFDSPRYYAYFGAGDPIPGLVSSAAIVDNGGWQKVSGCFSTTETDAEYIGIKTYINTSLANGGVVPATTYDPSQYVTPPLSGINKGTFWTSYFFIDDVYMKPLANAGPDQTVNCNTITYIGENCTPIAGAVYAWSPADAFTTANSTIVNPSSIYTAVNFSSNGTYVYNVTVTLNGCSSTDQVIVTFNNNLTVAVTSSTPNICGNSASFNATPNLAGTYTYNWVVKDASTGSILSVSGTGLNTATPTFNFAGINQNVNVCVTVNNGICSATNCITLLACCTTPPNTTKYTNTTFSTNTTLTGSSTVKFQFGGIITVSSGTLIIKTADVTMDPLTRFIVNPGALLKITESYVHGCNGMWNGIFALNNSTVTVDGSRVEDGIRTLLDSTGGASFTVNGNYFNKNYIAIHCKANKSSTSAYSIYSNAFTSSNLPAVTGLPYVTTIPALANASNLYSYSVSNLLAPYQSSKGYIGIYLLNSTQAGTTNNMIPIGSATTGLENIFDKLQIGAHIVRSNALVQNNVFQNIKNATNPGSLITGVSIYSYQNFLQPNCNVQIGGNTTSQKNTFIDNDYGVYSTYYNTLNIANNTFNTQTTGIYMQNQNLGLTADITKNKFIKNLKGISFNNNPAVTANIKENRFDNSSATVGNATNNAAITLSEPTVPTGNPTSYGNYTVLNNYIDKYYNGIVSINTYNSQITDNEVHMASDNTAGNFQMGIKVDGSRYANATNNTVDMTSLNTSNWWWQYGVFYAYAQAPFINCNIINNVGTSIKIQGSCNTLANTNEFVNNKMSNAVYGVWLDAGDFNGHQAYWVGTTPYAGDNTWTGTMTKRTYVSNHANLSNSLLFTQSAAQFKVASTDAGDDANPVFNSFVGNNNSTANAANTCVAQNPTPVFRMSSNSNARIFAKAQQIAKGTLTPASSTNAANVKHMNRRYLLENMQFEGADVNADTVLANFITSINNSNIGTFNDIDSLLQSASLTDDSTGVTRSLASAKNNAIAPLNVIEQNQKLVNAIYISKLSGSLNASQIQQLKTLAVKCPDTDGHAVFIARAMLSGIDKTIYNSNCGNSRSGARMANGNEQEIIASSNITVYPNPANNDITVVISIDDTQHAKIIIYNLLGEIIKEKNLKHGESKIDVSELKTGTYLYTIIIDNNKVKNDKLIIIK